MIINGVELPDIDILDADVVEKIEEAAELIENTKLNTEGIKVSAAIRKICTAIMDSFNTIFGEGADKKLFGDKVNLGICINAFDQLNEAIEKNPELDKLASKYSPSRAQRRSKK